MLRNYILNCLPWFAERMQVLTFSAVLFCEGNGFGIHSPSNIQINQPVFFIFDLSFAARDNQQALRAVVCAMRQRVSLKAAILPKLACTRVSNPQWSTVGSTRLEKFSWCSCAFRASWKDPATASGTFNRSSVFLLNVFSISRNSKT